MKTAHWLLPNQSGMHHLAVACALAEERLGHQVTLVNLEAPDSWKEGGALDADIHVVHAGFPRSQHARVREATGRLPRIVCVSHGLPEHMIEESVNAFNGGKDEPEDLWMLLRHWLTAADAMIVFSERQQAILRTMVSKKQSVCLVPLGVDRAFWSAAPAREKLRGTPAVWMSENQNRVKWALDVLIAWPFLTAEMPDAHLHGYRIPLDLHRFLIDLANTNGAAFHADLSPNLFSHEELRNRWKGCDFLLSPTRYGDPTCLVMEAEAAGLKTITYPGNQYSSFWIHEGDQRVMAAELGKIFRGEIAERKKLPVPTLDEMGRALVNVYEGVLAA